MVYCAGAAATGLRSLVTCEDQHHLPLNQRGEIRSLGHRDEPAPRHYAAMGGTRTPMPFFSISIHISAPLKGSPQHLGYGDLIPERGLRGQESLDHWRTNPVREKHGSNLQKMAEGLLSCFGSEAKDGTQADGRLIGSMKRQRDGECGVGKRMGGGETEGEKCERQKQAAANRRQSEKIWRPRSAWEHDTL
ncbi:unnamed protein product [Pleuronectes platessa]|uniref:Uncharacterized protein n=1 Tax=Pleuronectes platessa TaxID=8262 RepID=A0A9N7URI3_PLEPL|nr:unnamed protein product [Pleuronectes platessa]